MVTPWQYLKSEMSQSLRRGDTVAVLEARDADLTDTCHGNECPCARQAFAIESGNTAGLFAIDGSTGKVSAASELADHDGEIFVLDVSVVNQGLDVRTGSDVRGPKNYGKLTVVIGQPGPQADFSDSANPVHIRHKRASVFLFLEFHSCFYFALLITVAVLYPTVFQNCTELITVELFVSLL